MIKSRYFGIFLGYLPYEGIYEFKTYVGGVISGSFDPKLKHILACDARYYRSLLGQHCCFYLDENLKCSRIKSNEHFEYD